MFDLFMARSSLLPYAFAVFEIFPTDAGQLSDKLKFLAGQNKILQDRRLVCYQITISFCQKSQDICQTNWTFLQDRMKICQFCQTVLQFSQRLHLYGHHTFVWEKCWEFQTTSPLMPLGQCCSNFMWSLLRFGERKIAKMVAVHWPKWLPCPYMVKTFFSRTI